MSQYGFFFDQSRCTGCQTCTVACKSYHELPPGPLKYLRVYQYEKGAFPAVRIHVQWIPCYHCENPACVDACPTEAIYKEEDYGAVLIVQDDCIGCRECYEACPYGAPVFESDEPDIPAHKCDMCIDRLEREKPPICVLSCPLRALDFGPLDGLMKKYGQLKDLEDLPDSPITGPAVVFKPSAGKRKLFPYDTERALELFMKRDPLPPIFTSTENVTRIPQGLVGRNSLVIKHESTDELMHLSRNDEG
jgi:anaerobic dimethyl sulfoxide reductase subunit B (iron-sulfur subunit)